MLSCFVVMTGLGPVTHVWATGRGRGAARRIAAPVVAAKIVAAAKTWVAGPSPAMTA